MYKTIQIICVATIILAGCGGGGASAPTTSAPSSTSTPNPTPSPIASVPIRTASTPSGGSSNQSGGTSSTIPPTLLSASYKTVVWQDNFAQDPSGSPDAAFWAMLTGNGVEYGKSGWGNNEAEYYLPSNATIANGELEIHGFADSNVGGFTCSGIPCMFSSARVTSVHTVDLSQPGFLEVSAELPTGTGSWPAIWLLPGTSPGQAFPPSGSQLFTQQVWPAGGELDMVEFMSRYASSSSLVQTTFHLPSGTSAPYADAYQYQQATLATPASSAFHLYQMAWSASQIEFFVDNTLVMNCEKSTLSCAPVNGTSPGVPATAFWPYGSTYRQYYLLLNLAIGGNLGIANSDNANVPTNFDQTMKVKYVRYLAP